MTPTNNIETLQKQVDQVKVDLEALKAETSESLKKTKVEAAADKVKNAKEEITKKLEALKGLTDANSQADISKLEAMLLTLESSDSELEPLKNTIMSQQTEKIVTEDKNPISDEKDQVLEEKKGWFKRQREGVTSKEEWKEHPLNNVGRIAMGVGAAALVYKGVKWLFGLGKGKDKTGEKSEEKKEKKSRWKKALIWAGIGTGGMLAWKNWDKIKGWFSGLFGKTNPDEGGGAGVNTGFNSLDEAKKSFDELPENTKGGLNTFGTNVNDLYQSLYKFSDGSISADINGEKLGAGKDIVPGVIPHILDNSFNNIDALQSQMGLFKIDMYGDVSKISKTLAGMVGTGLGKLAETVLSMVGFSGVLTGDNVEETIRTFLTGTNTTDDIRLVFRRIYKTMSYTAMMENVVVSKSIISSLQTGTPLYKKSGDNREAVSYKKDDVVEVQKLTQNIIESQQEYKLGDKEIPAFVVDVFRGKKLRDLAAMNISLQDIDTYNPYIKEITEDINKKRDASIEFLKKNKNEALDHIKAQVEDELGGGIFNSITKAIPYANLLAMFGVGDKTQLKNKIFAQGGYTKIFEEYKKSFEDLKKVDDIPTIQNKIDAYYAYIKEVSVNSAALYVMQDQHDNVALNIVTPVVNTVTGATTTAIAGFTLVVQGINEVADGKIAAGSWDTLKGGFYLSTGGGTLITLLGLVRGSGGMTRFGLKLAIAPIYLPTKYGIKLLGPIANTHMTNMLPSFLAVRFYTTPESLVSAIGNGMSTKSALAIYANIKKTAGNTTQLNQNFVKEILGIADQTDNGVSRKMMTELIDNKRYDVIDNMIESHLKSNVKFRKGKYINLDKGIAEFKPVYDILKQHTNIQELGYELLARTDYKQRSKIKDLLSRDDIVQELAKINKTEDINLMAKSLAKALKKVDNVTDNADTIKNIITNFKSIQTKAGNNVADVIETVVEQAASTHTTMTAEQILNQSDEITKQLQIIKTTDTYQDVVSLGLETNASQYANLLDDTDDVDNVARKILHQRNVADNKDYFTDGVKIAQAKAYAEFLVKSKQAEAAVETSQELTSISKALSLSDYNKLAKLINKGKSEDVIKFITKRLEKEGVENAGELAQKFADKTKGMQNVDKTEVAKIIGLSEMNTEKAIIAITKSLAKDKVFVASILALNSDQKLIAQALNDKCGLTGTNALIAEDSEYVQKLAKCSKSQDVEKALQYTSKGLKRRIAGAGLTAALAIAGAVMSILDAVHAFSLIETTNNQELKDIYRQRGFVDAGFAALDTLVSIDATCQLAYLALSIGQGAFMSTGVGAVVIVAAQGIRYLYDQYSLGAEFQTKNAEDRKKEGLGLYFIWYYRSGGKTSGENVKDVFGSAAEMPLANIVEGLIDQTLGIQEGTGTSEQQKVKGYMKEYIGKKYENKVDHLESGFSMLSEALEYATFAEYIHNITNGTVKQEQISPDMADFMSKYPLAGNQDNLIEYFNKYQASVNIKQTENLEKYKPNIQKYSEQELIFIYEQLGRYNNYYTLPVEGAGLFNAVRILLKTKNVDISKLQLNLEEPPLNRQQIEKFVATQGAEGNLQEVVGQADEVKGKIDQVVITDEDLIEKYGATPTLEIYTFLKIARIFGYTGGIELDGIKLFLSEDTKDRHGIYRDGKERNMNNTAFWSGFRNRFGVDRGLGVGDVAVQNLKANIGKMDFDDKYLGAFDSAGIQAKFDQLREDIEKKIELNKLQSILPVNKEEIVKYLSQNNGKYTLLSVQLLSRLLQKNNIKNSGHYLFKYENNKIIALTLDSQANEKLFFVDEFDVASSKLKYEVLGELNPKPILDKLQDIRKIINMDDDEFDVKQNPEIEKIIADKESEVKTFMSNLNNYDKIKQKELYYQKLEDVETFYQSFLISFLSQASDNTFSNDVDEESADEKILQATKYGERQNFNTVIVNKYTKEYNILQLSDQELNQLKTMEGGMDYVNYYYRGISLAMFKSYVLYQKDGVVSTQGDQSLDIDELSKNVGEIKSYKEYMKQYKGKDVQENSSIDINQKIEKIKTL